MARILKPFKLLEINIISAQDLERTSKKMKTYATAWVHPTQKLSTCVDAEGKNNPTWNDKFVFKVDDALLRQDTSAVMIEIYAGHWFRDVLVGTVRVLVGNLIPPPPRAQGHSNHHIGMRFVALQVRRPSGRPQGILNIGVALLDSSTKNMTLYRQLSVSAVGYRHLMDDPPRLQQLGKNDNNQPTTVRPILCRSKSERSERLTFVNCPPRSIVAIGGKSGAKESSILSFSDLYVDPYRGIKKKGKASSVINGAELREKPNHNKGKVSSVLSDSVLSKGSASFRNIEKPDSKIASKNEENAKMIDEKPSSHESGEKKVVHEKSDSNINSKNEENPIIFYEKLSSDESGEKKVVDEKWVRKVVKNVDPPKEKSKPPLPLPTIGKPISKYYVTGAPFKGSSVWSDSEMGPSPLEVAAIMAAQKKYPLEDNKSSVLDGWSLDKSVEGLKSKIERWRRELPPVYNHHRGGGGYSTSTFKSSSRHARRQSEPTGLFSCFGNIYGYECQCICGKPPERRRGTRFHSPSTGTPGRPFL